MFEYGEEFETASGVSVSDLTDDEQSWLDQQTGDANEPRSVENSWATRPGRSIAGSFVSEDQQALLMIDGEHASIKEVAEATGWSESKVKVRRFGHDVKLVKRWRSC